MNAFRWALCGEPVIRVAGRFPFSPENAERKYFHSTFALHQHHYAGRITIGRQTFDLRPGDVTISPPLTSSHYELAEAGYHWCVHFEPEFRATTVPMLRLPLHIPMLGGGAYVAERMAAIAEANQRSGKRKAAREIAAATASNILQGLLLLIALRQMVPRHRKQRSRRSDAILDAAKEQLDQRFSEPFKVSDLVQSSGLSAHYFSVRFQERFGLTVKAYVLNLRIEMARHLLTSTDLPIKEVAFECGIRDPNYFNKQFRRVIGTSPVSYRAQNQKV